MAIEPDKRVRKNCTVSIKTNEIITINKGISSIITVGMTRIMVASKLPMVAIKESSQSSLFANKREFLLAKRKKHEPAISIKIGVLKLLTELWFISKIPFSIKIPVVTPSEPIAKR